MRHGCISGACSRLIIFWKMASYSEATEKGEGGVRPRGEMQCAAHRPETRSGLFEEMMPWWQGISPHPVEEAPRHVQDKGGEALG